MRVSLEWLNELVTIDGLAPDVIAEALTNAGLEVESIETLGGEFSGVLVGKVDAVEPHPNADRLRLVQVNLGSLGVNRVVCGAPNVAPGMRIAYAQIGAKVLNRKEGGLFELKPAVIRGVESTGMICSLEELGLQDQYPSPGDGIWPVNDYATDADLGKDLKTVLNLTPDTVLEVTPNANRGDLMSMRGVAREVAALFKRPLSLPVVNTDTPAQSSPFQIRLEDAGVCQYYAGAVLENVTIGESPDWMKKRLLHSGIRAINNVVDITNYVMLEFGQPLHAFDIHKLGQHGTVGVRSARSGESFRSLDGVDRPLVSQSVVVTFDDRPIALGGVMGGEETEISDTTRHVFLESAYFPSASNRKSARSVGLRTESSARFERGVDPAACESAFYRAVALLKELAGATLQSVAKDDHRDMKPLDVSFSFNRMTQILGLDIPCQEAQAILTNLGFEITPEASPDRLQVRVPTFRGQDVTREIDLIEEVIRIYGYDNIPYTLPKDTVAPVRSFRSRLLDNIRQGMVGSGLTEVATHSLIGEALLRRTGCSQDPETTIHVANSQSIDHTFLRQSLTPNLLEIAKFNQAQGNDDIWIFELGKTYVKRRPAQEKDAGVEEILYLGGLLMNGPREGVWHQTLETDFYTAKGVVENLFAQLNLQKSPRWRPLADRPSMHPGQAASISVGKTEVGVVGRLHPSLQEELKFKAPVYLFELNVEALFEILQGQPQTVAVEALSAFPSVKRDIAFSASKTVTHQEVIRTLAKVNEPLLQDIQLFDEYTGAQLEAGTRSLAYRLTLQSTTGTLTEKEIDAAMDKLKRQLAMQLPVTFR